MVSMAWMEEMVRAAEEAAAVAAELIVATVTVLQAVAAAVAVAAELKVRAAVVQAEVSGCGYMKATG